MKIITKSQSKVVSGGLNIDVPFEFLTTGAFIGFATSASYAALESYDLIDCKNPLNMALAGIVLGLTYAIPSLYVFTMIQDR